MKYYAVIDTNVIVSSMLKHDSIPGRILDLVILNIIVTLLNNEILEEYFDVLTRNKFDFNVDDVLKVLDRIKENGIVLNREQTLEDFVDEDDIVFYEIVMSAKNTMDAYLIAGNIKHYPVRNYIVTPREMIEIIEEKSDKKYSQF